MPLPKPLNNNVLVEIIDKYSAIHRNDENERIQRGKVIDANFFTYHLTASSFGELRGDIMEAIQQKVGIGSVVRWQEYADSGQTFEQDGKKYALVPWWRLICVEEPET